MSHLYQALTNPACGLVNETRPLQIKLAEYLHRRMSKRLPSMSEAGTGIGKSFSYLLNAIELAQEGQRVVVSTGMKSLQAQLYFKDLPYLVSKGYSVKYARPVGKDNYGCKRQVMLHVIAPSELRVYNEFFDTVRHWVWDDSPQKLSERLPRNKRDYSVAYCNGSRCDFYSECEEKGYLAARGELDEAKLLLVNHALIGSDLRVFRQHETKILGDYSTLIADEAHKFPDFVRNALACDMPSNFFRKSEEKYREKHGDLKADFTAMMSVPLADQKRIPATPSPNHYQLEAQYRAMFIETQRTGAFGPEAYAFAKLCRDTVQLFCDELGADQDQLRRYCNERTLSSVKNAAGTVDDWGHIPRSFRQSESAMQLLYFIDTYLNTLWSFAAAIDLATKDGLHYVVAVETDERKGATIRTVPIDVADRLTEFYADRNIVPHYLSATLAVNSTFDFFAAEVGYDVHQPDATFMAGTPFNYEKQARLYVPRDLPEPSAGEEWINAVIDRSYELLMVNEGHAFILFTSYNDMHAVHRGLKARGYPYPMLVQSDELKPRGRELFLSTPHATLLGTRTFWEGIDIPGLHLSLVIIPKLPFPIYGDPIVKAKSTLAGDSWFQSVHMPMMLTDLRQMAGRLIRSTQDLGVVALLDRRCHSKGYGRETVATVGIPNPSDSKEKTLANLRAITKLRSERNATKR